MAKKKDGSFEQKVEKKDVCAEIGGDLRTSEGLS